jgi:galactokinase/galacturonokinase
MAEEARTIPIPDAARTLFVDRYGEDHGLNAVRAPYRVCPLGAHIDHQGGTVLGMSVDRGVTFLWRPGRNATVRLSSHEFPGEVTFSLDDLPPPRGQGFWGDYAAAAAWSLREEGHKLSVGLDGVVTGELPVGGLSSSAAVGLAYGVAFRLANGLALRDWDVIRSGLRGENGYVGVSCGLLDPTTIFFARKESLVRICCREERVSIVAPGRGMPAYTIGIVFSGVERALPRSGYNNRVKECRRAARLLGERAGRREPVENLGAITREEFRRHRGELPGDLRRRAEHYFGEAARVEQGLAAWRKGELAAFGSLVNESGASSVDNYEAGCPEIVYLWNTLRQSPGVYGTRFSGGGFGGAVIAIVDPAAAGEVEEEVRARYLERYPQCASGFRVEFRSSDVGLRWGRLG